MRRTQERVVVARVPDARAYAEARKVVHENAVVVTEIGECLGVLAQRQPEEVGVGRRRVKPMRHSALVTRSRSVVMRPALTSIDPFARSGATAASAAAREISRGTASASASGAKP
jgi:hypothetical protein